MMIVEFAGLPGGGKTTVCSLVLDKLKAAGISAANIHKSEKNLSTLQRKLYSFRSVHAPFLRDLRKEVVKYCSRYNGENNAQRPGNFMLKAVYKLRQPEIRALDCVVMDEGPTQYLTAIPHKSPLAGDADALVRKLNEEFYSEPVLLFEIQSGVDAAMERIRARGHSQDRFYSEDEGELRDMLLAKGKNLDNAMSRLNYAKHYVINNDNAERAAEEVFQHIMAYRK